ncbi:hypothetical protein CDD83_1081 [Cordyceps sp. RAO-2017]|nr:hypothetical protein CDD83_1081 [Cordyceps sp. RAO-2017]
MPGSADDPRLWAGSLAGEGVCIPGQFHRLLDPLMNNNRTAFAVLLGQPCLPPTQETLLDWPHGICPDWPMAFSLSCH